MPYEGDPPGSIRSFAMRSLFLRHARSRFAFLTCLAASAALVPSVRATDLKITKQAVQDTVNVGEEITYTLTVDNSSTAGGGPYDSPNTYVVDSLPAGLTFVSAQATQGACAIEGARLECALGTVAAGSSAVVTLVVRADAEGVVDNTGTVAGPLFDPDEGNNTSTATVFVRRLLRPVLELDVEALTRNAVGEVTRLRATVRNTGDDAARQVRLALGPAFGVFGSSVTPVEPGPSGCYKIGDLVRCDQLGTLAPGASVARDIPFRIHESIGRLEGTTEASNHSKIEKQFKIDFLYSVGDVLFMAINVFGVSGGKQAVGYDLYLDSVRVAEALAPGAVYPFAPLMLASDAPLVHVVPVDAGLDAAVFADTVAFYEGGGDAYRLPSTYALLVVGPEEAPRPILKRDARKQAAQPGEVDLFVAHGAPDAPPLDVVVLDDTPVHAEAGALAGGLAYGDASGYHSLAPASVNVALRETGSETVLDVFRVDLSGSAGRSMVLVVLPAAEEGAGKQSGSGLALAVVDVDGTLATPGVVTTTEAGAEPPRVFALHANYPNPFNPSTTVRFDVPEPGRVRLVVYDVLGRQVRVLVDGAVAAGAHAATFDAGPLASGAYVCRLETPHGAFHRRMLLVK